MRTMLLVFLVTTLAAFGFGQNPAPAEVTVEFAQRTMGVKSVSGFLHSLSGGKPPDSMIVPLRPVLWRDGPSLEGLARVKRLGARPIVVVSDVWKGEHQKRM